MPTVYSDVMTAREHLEHDWYVEEMRRRFEHDTLIKKLEIENKKIEIRLRQEDATKARRHQQLMKQLELEIRINEAKWNQIFRLPTMIIKLPLYCLFGIAFIVATAKGNEVNQGDFWKLLR